MNQKNYIKVKKSANQQNQRSQHCQIKRSLIYYQHILNIYITATDQWPKSQGFLRLDFTWNRVKVIIRKAEGYNEVKIKLTVLEEKRQCCS